MELKYIKTYKLVEELKNREGVSHYLAEPYKEKKITVKGPARVLIIID